jgi:hypothetical protein
MVAASRMPRVPVAMRACRSASARLAQSAVLGPIQEVDHVLALRGMVTVFPRRGQQGHPTWSLKLGKQVLIIRFTVHHHRLN